MEDRIIYAEETRIKSELDEIKKNKPFNHLGVGTLVNVHEHIDKMEKEKKVNQASHLLKDKKRRKTIMASKGKDKNLFSIGNRRYDDG